MTLEVFFAAKPDLWPAYEVPLREALDEAGIEARLTPEAPDPAQVDYIVYSPGGVIENFRPFTRARAVLNLWAGVEKIAPDPSLTQPLCRMVDPAMTEGMREYVVGMALRHHLGLDRILATQDRWEKQVPPLARERPIAVLGLGELGRACAQALVELGFPVLGWSRTPKTVPGIACHSGQDGLESVLRRAQIVVTLLPHTPDTEGLLDARHLGLLPRGAVLINPGRGALIEDGALISALDDGHLSHATLDVFRTEPLPEEHPFWAHPRITVTPHIAAETRPVTAARVIAENIRRGEAGEPLLHQVDRTRGY